MTSTPTTSPHSASPQAPRRLHDLLAPWVASQADATALQDDHSRYSFGELDAIGQAAAAQLRDWGVRPGDRVLIVGENCAAACVVALACSRLDAWVSIVNGRLSATEVDGIAQHAQPRRVIFTTHVSPEAVAHAERHGAQPVAWAGVAAMHLGPLNTQVQAEPVSADPREQVAALIYTSGTSGAPKGVMLTHANLLVVADISRETRRLAPGDRVYGVLPMAHIVGLSIQFLASLGAGATVVLAPRFSPESLAAAFASGVTAFTGVPALYAKYLDWLRSTGRAHAAPALRRIGVAGSPLTPVLKADVEAVFGLPMLNGYGLTETAPTLAQVRAGEPRDDCAVGPPIPGLAIRLVGAGGQDVAPGEVGELWVSGPNVMKGYYREPALTQAVLVDGWFNTGDMASQGPDGALTISGRTKELIIRSGFNVYPLEVEQVINAFAGVVQSAVVGRTVGHNEEVVAYVEVPSGRELNLDALRAHLRQHLSAYKQPSEIVVMAQLPAAPTGKLLKGQLKRMAQAAVDG